MDLLSGVYYTISREGETFGPYEGSLLTGMVNTGQLVATDHIWTEGMAEWLSANSFNQLAPLFQPAQVEQKQPSEFFTIKARFPVTLELTIGKTIWSNPNPLVRRVIPFFE